MEKLADSYLANISSEKKFGIRLLFSFSLLTASTVICYVQHRGPFGTPPDLFLYLNFQFPYTRFLHSHLFSIILLDSYYQKQDAVVMASS